MVLRWEMHGVSHIIEKARRAQHAGIMGLQIDDGGFGGRTGWGVVFRNLGEG